MTDPIDVIAARMLDNLHAARELPAATFVAMGARMTGREFAGLLVEALGASDRGAQATADGVRARLAQPLHPGLLPRSLGDVVPAIAVDPLDRSFAAHWGFDPLRLQLCALDGVGAYRRGRSRATCRPVFEDGRMVRLGLSFQIDRRVRWRDRQLTWLGGTVPAALAAGMIGRRLDEIIGHPWEGWGVLAVRRAVNRGDVLVVTTEPAEPRRLAA